MQEMQWYLAMHVRINQKNNSLRNRRTIYYTYSLKKNGSFIIYILKIKNIVQIKQANH